MCPTPHPSPAPVTGEANAFYATLRGYSAVISSVLEQAATVVESESSATAASATLVQFSNFKESQAKERGFLSGTLALPAAQLDSIPKRAFADLVVCVHQAKIHESSLQARQDMGRYGEIWGDMGRYRELAAGAPPHTAQARHPTRHEAATP